MPEAPASRFARPYTEALFAFALLAVVVAWVEVGVIGELEEQGRASGRR